MTTIPSFSAKHWIGTNCRGGHDLKPESVDVVSSFTLMWNIFEGAVCDNHAKIPVFERRANKIAQRGLLPPDIEDGVAVLETEIRHRCQSSTIGSKGWSFGQATAESTLRPSCAAKKKIPKANSWR